MNILTAEHDLWVKSWCVINFRFVLHYKIIMNVYIIKRLFD